MMQKCIACERLEGFIALAYQDGDAAGITTRTHMLIRHQHGGCINRDWHTGHVRVAVSETSSETQSITLKYAGAWPGGHPAYVVERGRA